MTGEAGTTRDRRDRPLVIVHTGDGKGKSTAAFGLALRGWKQGWSIGVYQFIKSGKWRVGERTALLALNDVFATTGQGGPVEWESLGSGWTWSRAANAKTSAAELAREGWAGVKDALAREEHTLYLLDEFNHVLHKGWVDVAEVIETLASRPGRQHVVITGRNAPQELIDAADLVTEMRMVRHPFTQGQRGQAGIEW